MINKEIFSTTKSICPKCKLILPASIYFENDSVFMSKICCQHGEFVGLIYTDRNKYIESLTISKPPQNPLIRFVNEHKGCPDSCGLCPEHKQHTCLPIIEITNHCNMQCPICLADNRNNYFMTPDTFQHIIDNLISAEGTFELINISGGEPLLHPHLLEMIDIASRNEIVTISISTNGKYLLQNEEMLLKLVKKNVFIALQFDGFDESAYQILRGHKLLKEKIKILELLEKHSAPTSLVMTVMNDMNNLEIRNVVKYFLEKDFIKSLMFQPVAFLNPNLAYNIKKVMTIPDIAKEIANGTNGVVKESDIINVPCSHPTCFAATYLLVLNDGSFIPVPRLIPVDDYLDIIKNRSMPGLEPDSYEKIKDYVYNLWSVTGLQPESKNILKTIKNILCEIEQGGRLSEPKNLFKIAKNKLKSIFIHNFMDAYNFDFERVQKCCNHYPVAKKQLIPCCVQNNLRRWK